MHNRAATIWTIAWLTLQEAQRRRILRMAVFLSCGFLFVFGAGFRLIYLQIYDVLVDDMQELNLALNLVAMAGLYVINFLIVMLSVLIAVGTISGEIDSHAIDALLTKPIRRSEIIVGKWLGNLILLLLFVLLLAGGAVLLVYLQTGYLLNNIAAGIGLMFMEGMLMVTLTIFGGTKMSTLANGSTAFMLYGIAFVGGWVEQVGAMLESEMAVDLGIFASLIMPSDALWRLASLKFQPPMAQSFDFAGPFAVGSEPSRAMVVYAALYTAVLLGGAIYRFSKRDL